jgi:3-oxoacyl-[acyl-carrier-protein] synthase III
MNPVYITHTASFLPNEPVSNDRMEAFLGFINDKPSRSKAIVLRNNGIKQRYYAMDEQGRATHQNAELAAETIRRLFSKDPAQLSALDLICCGTSSPDQMMPSHAVQVHGYLPETGPVEVVSPAGVCCAGMHALKYAYLSIRSGDAREAVAVGSERFSKLLRSEVFNDEAQKLEELEINPYISFEKDFLRWMLSDGSAGCRLSAEKPADAQSLRIEWIEGISFANQIEPCMYMGSEKMPDGSLRSFKDYDMQELVEQSILSIKQDVRLLSENIVSLGGRELVEIFKRRGMKAAEINHFLVHMSSDFFRTRIHDGLKEMGLDFPYEKWMINLPYVGNVGAASIYLMVDELFQSGKLKQGEKVLLLVPESSRFSYVFCLLTVC